MVHSHMRSANGDAGWFDGYHGQETVTLSEISGKVNKLLKQLDDSCVLSLYGSLPVKTTIQANAIHYWKEFLYF